MADSGPPASPTDRVAALVVAPFVLGWDLLRSAFFFLCRVMEKLDPFAAITKLFDRLTPPLSRLFRRWWNRTLVFRMRVKALAVRFTGWFLRVVRPLVRAVHPVVQRVRRSIAAAARWLAIRLSGSFEVVRRATAPVLRRTGQIWRRVSAAVRAPVRRAVGSIRQAVHRGSTRR